MGVRKARLFVPAVFSFENVGVSRLAQNTVAVVETENSVIPVSYGLGNFLQRNLKLLVNPCDLFCFGDGIPLLRAVDVFEAHIVPNLFPRFFNDRQSGDALSQFLVNGGHSGSIDLRLKFRG